ncbi:hypothetical protein CYLTODRAFT_490764 [Cylindrobasidium torrendii FP15055 ss-10]|uniref:Uncharacterized protein n=1 Tax=Cylindrobasidium torrendii FP15055 ss-10 TaxID=1314674 RepID=A0A0D7BAU6_9AGAR|nr:hypothetical protein CYLTODRAFT_490764 [Cylindrobasidium torrendii FP15055 ss-10]
MHDPTIVPKTPFINCRFKFLSPAHLFPTAMPKKVSRLVISEPRKLQPFSRSARAELKRSRSSPASRRPVSRHGQPRGETLPRRLRRVPSETGFLLVHHEHAPTKKIYPTTNHGKQLSTTSSANTASTSRSQQSFIVRMFHGFKHREPKP